MNAHAMEKEILDVVASAATPLEELPSELLEAIAALEELGDEELWPLARQAMSQDACQELEALHSKQRDDGLNQEEDAKRARLIREYERTMLTRAQAASLLKARGNDVSTIVAQNPSPSEA